jgi:hypothetical protein
MKHNIATLLIALLACQGAFADPSVNIHSAMMESTFAIIGRTAVEGPNVDWHGLRCLCPASVGVSPPAA